MDYSRYKDSRDATWWLLIKHGISSLPVKVSSVCNAEGLVVSSYEKGMPTLKELSLLNKCKESDGFTVGINGEFTIFFNETCSTQRSRFTIAHELGHYMLGHLLANKGNFLITTVNREPTVNDDLMEQQANVFASRLLAPACVLWGLNVKSAENIAKFSDISQQAAEFRMERINTLYAREKEFLKTKGYSCFLLSGLERQVFTQFKNYIDRNKL